VLAKQKANKTKTKDRAAWTKVGQKSGWLAFVCLRPLSWKMTIPRLMTLLNWWRRWRALFLIFLSPLSVYTPQFRKRRALAHQPTHTHMVTAWKCRQSNNNNNSSTGTGARRVVEHTHTRHFSPTLYRSHTHTRNKLAVRKM